MPFSFPFGSYVCGLLVHQSFHTCVVTFLVLIPRKLRIWCVLDIQPAWSQLGLKSSTSRWKFLRRCQLPNFIKGGAFSIGSWIVSAKFCSDWKVEANLTKNTLIKWWSTPKCFISTKASAEGACILTEMADCCRGPTHRGVKCRCHFLTVVFGASIWWLRLWCEWWL